MKSISKTIVLFVAILLIFSTSIHADDVKVQLDSGDGFVIADQTGANERIRFNEDGSVLINGLSAADLEDNPVCYDSGTGQLGDCDPNTFVGPAGPQGPQGDTGSQGIQGDTGSQGIQGLDGPQGMQGIQGDPGIQGAPGLQGIQGPIGATGAQGDPGIQGIQGIQGPAGTSGGSVDIYGNASNLITTISSANWVTTREVNPQFGDLTITGTLTVPSGGIIQCTGTLTINGTILVSPGIIGRDRTTSFPALIGLAQNPVSGNSPSLGIPVSVAANYLKLGPYAGTAGEGEDDIKGGGGGGAFTIFCKDGITFGASGKILANGGDGEHYVGSSSTSSSKGGTGGGGGGFVLLASQSNITIPNANQIEVQGGNGGNADPGVTIDESGGAGGGGGIVHFMSPNANALANNRVLASGGPAGNDGGATPLDGTSGNAGGGLGGNGGLGGDGDLTSGGAGQPGYTIKTQVANPEFLILAK